MRTFQTNLIFMDKCALPYFVMTSARTLHIHYLWNRWLANAVILVYSRLQVIKFDPTLGKTKLY